MRRIDNHDLMGIGTPIAAGAAHAATGSGAAAVVAGVLKGMLDNPSVKSRLAFAINKAQSMNPTLYGRPSLGTALSRIEAYKSQLANPVQNQQSKETQPAMP